MLDGYIRVLSEIDRQTTALQATHCSRPVSMADMLARIVDHPARRLDHLLPWHRSAFKASVVAVDRAA